jgi:lipopolysaccharide export system protein LptA
MRLRPADLAPALCAALLCLASHAAARESDRQQEMSLAAEDGDAVLADDGETKLTGNVLITQGTLRIEAGSATIVRKGGAVSRVLFEGRPASLQQEGEDGRPVRASAQKIEYDVDTEVVTLTGNVAVNQGGDDLRGQRVVYDLKNERLNASGQGGSDGRIRMTIQPRAQEPAAEKDADKGTGN